MSQCLCNFSILLTETWPARLSAGRRVKVQVKFENRDISRVGPSSTFDTTRQIISIIPPYNI